MAEEAEDTEVEAVDLELMGADLTGVTHEGPGDERPEGPGDERPEGPGDAISEVPDASMSELSVVVRDLISEVTGRVCETEELGERGIACKSKSKACSSASISGGGCSVTSAPANASSGKMLQSMGQMPVAAKPLKTFAGVQALIQALQASSGK